MKAIEVFTETMAMIDEMTDTGELDTISIADYKARAPYILTSIQNEINAPAATTLPKRSSFL